MRIVAESDRWFGKSCARCPLFLSPPHKPLTFLYIGLRDRHIPLSILPVKSFHPCQVPRGNIVLHRRSAKAHSDFQHEIDRACGLVALCTAHKLCGTTHWQWIVVIFLIVLFFFAHKKQTKYVCNRIDEADNCGDSLHDGR